MTLLSCFEPVCSPVEKSHAPQTRWPSPRLRQDEQQLQQALDARHALQEQVEQVRVENAALKVEYDAMLELQRGAESQLREEKIREGHLLDDMIYLKKQAAARMNSRNERKSRYLKAARAPLTFRYLKAAHTPVH